jgi:tRNA(fMet)-specific endonuclease VapC
MEGLVMPKALLDTDMFSEALRGKNPNVMRYAAAYEQTYGAFLISAVTLMELVKGFEKNRRLDVMDSLLADMPDFDVLAFDETTARIAGRIASDLETRGLTIGRADPMIAATAIQHELALATGNTKHFQRIRDMGYPLPIENWRDL